MRPAKDNAIARLLSAELLTRARCLAGELAWPPEDALQVADCLASAAYDISGLELWQDVDGRPRWIASSAYDLRDAPQEEESIRWCARQAIEFIRGFASYPGALFHFI